LRNSPRHPRASIAQSSYLRFTILSGGNIRDELAGDFFAATFKYGLLLRRLLQLEGSD
jgi:hypothetical protein